MTNVYADHDSDAELILNSGQGSGFVEDHPPRVLGR